MVLPWDTQHGKALTSGGMLFTFNKRHFSDSKLGECVVEEAWLSSLPLALLIGAFPLIYSN